ncbi:MAG TPA: hypothetical protein VM925_06490 [Labilithrix sp.]|nr:hypothetical protein [Labilithrix sp.]
MHLERKLTDLVEEQRPAVCLDERSVALAVGAGERAALVSEELALDQIWRDRATVEGDERTARTMRARMDRVDEDVFANAALALDEDAHVGPRRALEQREEVTHRGRFADSLPEARVWAERKQHRCGLDVEGERRSSDDQRGRLREDDVIDAERADPRSVGAPEVPDVDTVAAEGQPNMLARDRVVGQAEVGARACPDDERRALDARQTSRVGTTRDDQMSRSKVDGGSRGLVSSLRRRVMHVPHELLGRVP